MMDMMNSIAAQSVSMAQDRFSMQYGVSVAKKAMDATTQQALGELEMLPDQAQMRVPKGHYIDVLV